MENKIKDFRTSQNMQQAANICAACGTFMQIALGEVCSLDAFNGKRFFSESEAKSIIPAFKKVLHILSKAHSRYNALALEIAENGSSSES